MPEALVGLSVNLNFLSPTLNRRELSLGILNLQYTFPEASLTRAVPSADVLTNDESVGVM